MSDKETSDAKKPVGKREGKGTSYADKLKNPAPRVTQPKFTGDCEELTECIFDCQDKQQSGKFETTLDKLANYVGSKYQHGGDIRKVIKTLSEVTLEPPTAPEAGADMTTMELWKIELSGYAKRKAKLVDNKQKLFSLVWGQCTPHMKSKLEANDDFEQIDANQDPIMLLKNIKGMTYRFDDEKYLGHAITEATMRFNRLFQGREMTNSQYLERFKSMAAVIEHYGGSVGFNPKIVMNHMKSIAGIEPTNIFDPRFTDTQRIKAIVNAREEALACQFLMGADKARYGDVITDIQNDFAKGLDSYPKTVTAAYSLMVNWVPKYTGPRPNVQHGSSFAQGADLAPGKIECWGCGKADVLLSSCTNPTCMAKWKSKQARRQEKGEQHLNVDDPDNVSDDDQYDWDDEDSFDIGEFQGYQFTQAKPSGKVNKECILLDNQSTHDTFYNADLLQNIKKERGSVIVHTNGGSITYDQSGILPGYGKVWFNPQGIANILSLARVENKGHTVKYHQGKFVVTNKKTKNVSTFEKQENGLFMHDTTKKEEGTSFVQTVKENMDMYTPRQIAKAKAARELYAMVGRPSMNDYVGIIKNGLLPNATVHVSDIHNAESIYGQDLGAIQGKTTRTQPTTVPTDYVDVPPDLFTLHQRVSLCLDVMFINGIPFFVSVSRNIKFTTIEKLNNRKAQSLVNATIKVCRLYQRRGFLIQVCLMDNEFEVLRGELLREGIALNTAAPEEHVPEIERRIRTIKERVRSVIHTIPFQKLPDLVVIHAAIFCVMWLNFFPPSGGVSPTLSPQTIVTGLAVDHNKHCRMPFGAYAQVHAHPNPTNNAMVARTVGAISLGPAGNIQGSYYFMSLLTGKRIKARSFTPLPMPEEAIKQVEAYAPAEGVEEGVLFQDRTGQDEWMTEVDAAEEYFDANEYLPDEEADEDVIFRPDQGVDEDELQDLREEQQEAMMQVPEARDTVPGVDEPQGDETTGVAEQDADGPVPDEVPSEDAEPDQDEDEDDETFVDAAQESSDDEGINNDESGDDTASTDSDEQDRTLQDETTAAPEDRRVRGHTRSGRKIRIGKHLFDSYQFVGKSIPPDAYTPSVQSSYGRKPGSTHEQCPGFDGVNSYAFTQYSLKQGIRKFPEEAPKATIAEMKQLHDKNTFKPCHPSELTEQEKQEAIGSIIFIKEKRCGRVKARACADGRPQRLLYNKHDASSPTVKTESVILSAVQDAAEERDVAVTDIPGAFLNAELEERVHMKLVGVMADLLIAAVPEVYAQYAFKDEKGQTVLYVLLTRALYGCLKSALQFWKHLSGNLVKNGYELNPHDTCVANKVINGAQCTITWHVDDLKISHRDKKVVDNEIASLEAIYGKMVTTRGKEHTYLGMDFDFTEPGEVSVSMIPYMTEIVEEFPDEIPVGAKTPAATHLFTEDEDSPKLDKNRAKTFHHTVAKILWASMRARPDLLTALSFLTSRVQSPTEDDYKKLLRLLSNIRETIDLKLILSADGTAILKWFADASFATRSDYKSQTGVSMTMGKGSIYSMARKQKLNTKSSTEAELVGADDILPQMVWTRNFMITQGWMVAKNVLFQDNQSAMLLEKNGRGSSSRRTRHINIKFFFIKDRVSSGEVEIEYCPTDDMVGDYFTKPLQGHKFLKFRAIIMGEKGDLGSQECVGEDDEKTTDKGIAD